MKRRLAIISAILALVLSFGSMLTACGRPVKDEETTLNIQAYNRGYGVDGLNAIADAYRAKHPDIEIVINPVVDNTIANDIYQGPSIATDLYLNGGDPMFKLIKAKSVVIDGVAYDSYFEPLTEVYNYVPEGETRPLKEKMYDGYERYYNVKDGERWTEDTYFCAPWVGGLTGLIYNSKMFEKYEWTVPNTTDELVELSKQIVATSGTSTNKNSTGKSIRIAPFLYSRADSYWETLEKTWVAQYDGVEGYINYWKGLDPNTGEVSATATMTDGRLNMLLAMDQILGTYKKVGDKVEARSNLEIFCDPKLSGKSYTEAQSTFMLGEGAPLNNNGATTSAMMINGDWLVNEMKANFSTLIESGQVAFEFMKTPVISSIIDHADCATIENDAELSALIKAIDAGSNALSGTGYDVDQKAFDKIYEARNVIIGSGNCSAYIPIFSNAKPLAKDFLKFMFSDEGLKIYTKTTQGQDIPFELDYDGIQEISSFQKSKLDMFKNAKFVVSETNEPLSYMAGLRFFQVYIPFENKFNVSDSIDYVDPLTIYNANFTQLQNNWATMRKDAGI